MSGEYPIVMRIIKDRRKRYITLNCTSKPEHWDDLKNLPKKQHPLYNDLMTYLAEKNKEVQQVILDLQKRNKPFTVEDIYNSLSLSIKIKDVTVFKFFDCHIQNLINENRIGTANVFKSTYNQVKRFRDNKDLSFYDLNPIWIKRFDEWILKRGVKLNAAYVYVRTLKTLVNKAIAEGLVHESHNPFKGISFSKYRKDKPQKRALKKSQIEAIKAFDAGNDVKLKFAKNLYLFSYFTNGMNFIDIAQLKWSDIKNDRIHYVRKKTKEAFTIGLIIQAKEIINEYRTFYEGENSYVFPILSKEHITAIQIDYRLDKVLKYINASLKTIADKLEFEEHFTFYSARHSFATISRNSGVSVGMISEALGHETEKTTQIYLDSFGTENLTRVFENVL